MVTRRSEVRDVWKVDDHTAVWSFTIDVPVDSARSRDRWIYIHIRPENTRQEQLGARDGMIGAERPRAISAWRVVYQVESNYGIGSDQHLIINFIKKTEFERKWNYVRPPVVDIDRDWRSSSKRKWRVVVDWDNFILGCLSRVQEICTQLRALFTTVHYNVFPSVYIRTSRPLC